MLCEESYVIFVFGNGNDGYDHLRWLLYDEVVEEAIRKFSLTETDKDLLQVITNIAVWISENLTEYIK